MQKIKFDELDDLLAYDELREISGGCGSSYYDFNSGTRLWTTPINNSFSGGGSGGSSGSSGGGNGGFGFTNNGYFFNTNNINSISSLPQGTYTMNNAGYFNYNPNVNTGNTNNQNNISNIQGGFNIGNNWYLNAPQTNNNPSTFKPPTGGGGTGVVKPNNNPVKDGVVLNDYNIKLDFKKEPNKCNTFASQVKNVLENNSVIKGLLEDFKKSNKGVELTFTTSKDLRNDDPNATTTADDDFTKVSIIFNESLISTNGFLGEIKSSGNGIVDNIGMPVTKNAEESLVKILTHEIIHAQKDAIFIKAYNESNYYGFKSELRAYNWMVQKGYSRDTIDRIFQKDVNGSPVLASEDHEHAWMNKNSISTINKAIQEHKTDAVDIKKCNS